MKRTIAILTFVFALALSGFSTPTSNPAVSQSKEHLSAMIANAKTPADHLKIAAYYRAQSESYLAESNEHAKMAADFAKNPATNNDKVVRGTLNHCKYLAQSLKAKSQEAGRLAEQHEQMAKAAEQK